MTDQRAYVAAIIVVFLAVVIGLTIQPTQGNLIVNFGTLIALAFIGMLQAKASTKVAEVAVKVDDAAVKVEQVAITAAGSDHQREQILAAQSDLKLVADATHKLVNSAMGAQLRLLMLAYERAAARADASPTDHQMYQAARDAYERHMEGQARVDAAKAPPDVVTMNVSAEHVDVTQTTPLSDIRPDGG